MAIGCATGPATLAGNVVLTNAELLAGIALLQLFHPGAPTFYGSCSTVMELRRGGVTGGGPEDALLQAAKVFSFEQLLMDCEIFDMLRHLAAGIPVDQESLAVEVIEAVGPRGHFMEQEHTRKHMREIWQPTLLDRMPLDAWEKAGRPTALSRARERAREILEAHQPEPLRCEQQIRDIVLACEGSER